MRRYAPLLFFFLFFAFQARGQIIVINEFQASNSNVVADEDGDFSDWIELFNNGDEEIGLGGYGLSDDLGEPMKWVFPDTVIAPGSHLLIWASGKDRAVSGDPLHTNWSISSSGEDLLISAPDGSVMHHIPPIEMLPEIAYGLFPDGNGTPVYFSSPTPGAANIFSDLNEILEPVTFSHEAGFYDEAFNLTLSHPDPDVTIIYTVDGSDPDPSHVGGASFSYKTDFPYGVGQPFGDTLSDTIHSFVYSGPVPINFASRGFGENAEKVTSPMEWFFEMWGLTEPGHEVIPVDSIYRTTVIRAKAFRSGALSNATDTRSYIVDATGRDRFQLPIVAISLDRDKMFGYEDGIYTTGLDFDQWRLNNPDEQMNCDTEANYRRRGMEWEVPAQMEFFPRGQPHPGVSQRAGIRIHGECGRIYHQKAMRLTARGLYGKPEFEYPFFPQEPSIFKHLILRNGGDDIFYAMMRDPVADIIAEPLRLNIRRYSPTIVLLNGEYWGLHNMRERIHPAYFLHHYGIEENELDILRSEDLTNQSTYEVVVGDDAHFMITFDALQYSDLSDSANFAFLSTLMDIENFTDYFIANIFIANMDWPDRNVTFWRKRSASGQGAHDGRWRCVMDDCDYSLGLHFDSFVDDYQEAVNTDMMPEANPYYNLNIYPLFQNPEYVSDFANRFADLLNSAFTPQRTVSIIDSVEALLETSIPEHLVRWAYPFVNNADAWAAQVDIIRNYVTDRPNIQRDHVREFLSLGEDFTLGLDVSDPHHGYVRVNTIDIVSQTPGIYDPVYPWTGEYFKGVPITLTAIPRPGHIFSHWVGLNEPTDTHTAAFDADSVSITAVFMPDTSAIADSLVIHYWHFNALPSGEYDAVMADSSVVGLGFITYPGTGDGYMDDVDDGSAFNLHFGETDGRGLRVRNPSDTRSLVFAMPTTGYENIVFSYAVNRTNMGNQRQVVEYRTGPDEEWITLPDSITVTPEYEWHTYDLQEAEGVSDNADFLIRIRFVGLNADATSGNNRFDNVSLSGTPLPCSSPVLAHYFHFNGLEGGELEVVTSHHSITAFAASITYPGTGGGYMDEVSDGTYINGHLYQEEGSGLRVRNPSDMRDLVLSIPTDDLFDIRLSYAVKRTSNGQQQQVLSYRRDSTHQWTAFGDTIMVTEDYLKATASLVGIGEANDNPDLQVRISFLGDETLGTSGNNRFDNISVHGTLLVSDVVTVALCEGGTYDFNGQSVTAPGTYYHLVQNATGCDSLAQVLVLESLSDMTVLQETACGNYAFNGTTLSSSGVYTDTLVNIQGCDSIIELHLQVFQSVDTLIQVSACGSYLLNGTQVTESGIYTYVHTAVTGCDSTVAYDVDILSEQSIVMEVSVCDEYIFDGDTLESSGTYLSTHPGQNGCDSLTVLNLTVVEIDSGLTLNGNVILADHAGADSYQWVDCENDMIPLEGESSPVLSGHGTGMYAVIIVQDNCTSVSDCILYDPSSAPALATALGVEVFPNPNTGLFNVRVSGVPSSNEMLVQLMNAMGQTVYSRIIDSTTMLPTAPLNINIAVNDAPGLYFLRVSGGSDSFLKTVVIR
jgi:hypothetical protein